MCTIGTWPWGIDTHKSLLLLLACPIPKKKVKLKLLRSLAQRPSLASPYQNTTYSEGVCSFAWDFAPNRPVFIPARANDKEDFLFASLLGTTNHPNRRRIDAPSLSSGSPTAPGFREQINASRPVVAPLSRRRPWMVATGSHPSAAFAKAIASKKRIRLIEHTIV